MRLLNKIRRLFLIVLILAASGCGSKAPYEGKKPGQLEEMLRSDDPAKQAQGAFGLSLHGPGAVTAVPGLIEACQNKDSLVRQNAILALGKIGPEARDSIPALKKALSDPDWPVQRQAALALAAMGDEATSAIPELEKLVEQTETGPVRQAAQEALKKIRSGS